jgi:putative hemolysin
MSPVPLVLAVVLASAVAFEPGLPLGPTLAVSAVLLTLSFLFSGTETALFSLQKLQRQRLEAAGGAGAQATRLLERRAAVITTILIGNETVNVAFANTGARLFEDLTPYAWLNPWLNILVVTPILVLLSEITPKVVAFRFNARWARAAAWPLTAFQWLVVPVRVVVSGVVGVLARGLGVTATARDEGIGEAELLSLLDQGARAGSVDLHEREMIEALFEFDELTVGRLKTPRPDVFALPLDTPWDRIVEACREEGYSRIPLYENDPDDIVGVLLLKDVLKHLHAPPEGPLQLRSLLLPPVFVPQSKPAQDMLRVFLDRRLHIAFVVDEHGTLVGLVTLDDLLSELFGDFLDEDDDDGDGIQRLGPGGWAFDAALDLEDVEEEIGLALPEGDYHTLGGFVFHRLGRLPHKGDAFTWQGHRFVVRRMTGRRIDEVLVRLGPGAPASVAPGRTEAS